MNASRHQVSLGALALVLCLALPMGVLSLLAPPSTGDEIDAADVALMARVLSMQHVAEADNTILEFGVLKQAIGPDQPRLLTLTFPGRPPVEVGDLVVALLSLEPPTIHGAYQVQKDGRTLEYMVVTPITGMWSEGILESQPVGLEDFLEAIRVRKGGAPGPGDDATGDADDGGVELGIGADAYEPNDDLASATPVFPGPPVVLTGMPLELTGLTITPGDVDFFSFQGPGLSILHAETKLPQGVTSLTLDTLLGAFHVPTGKLLGSNDDKDSSGYSRLVIPLEQTTGPFAVAVESAPDDDLSFDGQDGTTVGAYDLIIELEKASYISNGLDMIAGVSIDGTFIEDFVGFKQVAGLDVLLPGKPADGWGISFDAQLPTGVSSISGGAGDALVPPVFNVDTQPLSFTLQPYVDSYGFNRYGGARSQSLVPYQLVPRRGVSIQTVYGVPLNQRVVLASMVFTIAADAPLTDLTFARVLDVDLFGEGPDTFHYKFDPNQHFKAFPVDTATNVSNLVVPANPTTRVTGDYQAALYVELGDLQAGTFRDLPVHRAAFTLVKDFALEDDAHAAAVQNLLSVGMDTWVVATDADPDSGLYTAFGVGLTARDL